MSKKAIFFSIIIILFCSKNSFSSFQILNKEEKSLLNETEIYTQLWAVAHPFKIKKAIAISKHVLQIVDSIEISGTLEGKHGGKLDAFRHVYWMILLYNEIGEKASVSLGNAHEKDNKLAFKRGKYFQDEMFSEMDFFNNSYGISVANKFKNSTKSEIQNAVIQFIKDGKVKIIKKDCLGNFLDLEGNILNVSTQTSWKSNKCLVNSDYSPC